MDDEEDDEEEDVGRNAASNDLNYDSDEKEETGDGDNTELISLDKQPNKKKVKWADNAADSVDFVHVHWVELDMFIRHMYPESEKLGKT